MSGTRSTIVATADGAELSYETARLLVETGPDRGSELVLLEQPVVLGRGSKADLSLSDPAVSRAHAVIQPAERGWRIRCLGGQGGTFVDGTRIEAAPLPPGSLVRIGETSLRFKVKSTSLRTGPRDDPGIEGLLGTSEPMRRLFGLVERVGALDLPVLLVGESGTGKERLARAVHRFGSVATGPFEVVDCTLLERDHLRSELFGHVKGAFTGAEASRDGAFTRAHGGTLFLDEVGELPLELQPTLLRVLQEGEVRPLGGSRASRVRVRVVSATHRDLPGLVAEGRFRQDLYYRLSALVVDVPPLRERAGDVTLLARHALPPGFSLGEDARQALEAHPWPGNVRELMSVVRRAAALADGKIVRRGELRLDAPPAPRPDRPPGPVVATSPDAASGPSPKTAEEALEAAIRDALAASGGNRKEAAKRLGIARSTLYKKLGKMGLA